LKNVCDLLHGAFAGVVELLCEGDLLGIELGSAATLASAGSSGGESVASVGGDQLALQLGEHGEHPEHRATFCGGRVDALLDDVQADAAFAQLGAEGHEVQDRSAEAVQARDLQRVAVAQQSQDRVELRSAGLRAAGVVDVESSSATPARRSASIWWSGFWSAVETRA
jgi:hypothetical protein